MTETTYIVIVNWNGYEDTIECVESLFSLEGDFKVVVIDNGSTNDSLYRLKVWLEELSSRSYSEKFNYLCNSYLIKFDKINMSDIDIALIKSDENLGFAGGNNIGIEYALRDADCAFIWLLNNDCTTEPDSLQKMLDRMKEVPSSGFCGSTLVYYHERDKIQALGGAQFFPFIGAARHIGADQNIDKIIDVGYVERKLDYIIGASMLVRRKLIDKVGVMSADYFLYYEEVDWALRAKKLYSLVYAKDSIVYHKAGKSIGSNRVSSERSDFSDFYLMRNRIVLTKKFYSRYILTVYLMMLLELCIRLKNRQWKKAKQIVTIILR